MINNYLKYIRRNRKLKQGLKDKDMRLVGKMRK
jgi:hypothetical protein